MKKLVNNNQGEVLLYKNKLEVHLEKETVWLTQKNLADLFNTERSVITKHIHNIFDTGELTKRSNVQKMHIASSDKPVALYNLDVIISVGYRVNSKQGIQFRIWATNILRKHLVDGYTLNEKRLQRAEAKYTKRLAEKTFIQQFKKKLPIFYTLLPKTTVLLMVISVLRRLFLFVFFKRTNYYFVLTN